MGVFKCFINILNAYFKLWAGRPTKNGFYTYFKYFENKNDVILQKITRFIK